MCRSRHIWAKATITAAIFAALAYFAAPSIVWLIRGGFAVGVVLPNEAAVLGDIQEPRGRALMAAVFHDDENIVRKILEDDPRLAETADGVASSEIRHGLLHIAIARENKRMVDLLLSEHVSPNFPPQTGPLRLALAANDPWYATRLLHAGANPNPLSVTAPFPLSYSAELGDIRSMALLVQNGADLTWTKTFGRSALVDAVNAEEFRAAEYLIDHGADIWTIDPRPGRSLSFACSNETNIFVFTRERSIFGAIFDEMTNGNLREELAARSRVRAKLMARGYPCPAPRRGDLAKVVLAGQWPPLTARRLGAPSPSPDVIAEMAQFWNPDGTRKRQKLWLLLHKNAADDRPSTPH